MSNRSNSAVGERTHIDYEEQLREANAKLLVSSVRQHELIERLEIAEKALSYLGLVVASSLESVMTVDFYGMITTWNGAAEHLYGYPANEAVGKSITMLTLPIDMQMVLDNIEKIRKGGKVAIFETVRIQKGGDEIDLEIMMSPVVSAEGGIIGVSTIARDITEVVKARGMLEAYRLSEVERKGRDLVSARANETRLAESQMRLAMELSATQQLQKVSTQMIGTDDPSTLYDNILDAAMQITRAQFASIQLLYPERGIGGELFLLGHRGLPPEAAEFWEWVTLDNESSCGQALRTGQRVIIANIEADPQIKGSADQAIYLQAGINAAQTTPLVSLSGRLLGMVSTYWARPHVPTDRDFRLLDVLARQAADLIERSQASAALRESDEKFRALADNIPQLAWMTEPDGSIFWYNERWYEYTGTTLEEMRGWGWQSVHHPDEVECVTKRFKACLESGESFDDTFPIRARNGEYGWFLTRAVPIRDSEGNIVRWFGTNTDITDQRRIEDDLRNLNREIEKQSRLFDSTINSISDFAYTFDRDGRFVFINQPLLDLWGLSLKEAVGKNFIELGYPEELAARLQNEIRHVFNTGESVTGETPYTNPAGENGYYEYIFSASLAEDGSVEYVAGSTRDITDRKAAENSIRFQAHLLDTVEQSAIATDLEGNVIYWNRYAEKLYGWTAKEAIGRPIIELTTPDIMAEEADAIMSQLRHGKSWSGEFKVKRRDGTVFPAYVINSPINDKDSKLSGIIGVSVDITDRKRAEEEVRSSREELEFRVEERTAELAVANETLKAENRERLRAEEERVRVLHRLVTAQEDERRRIGRDLHDQLGQQVTALRLKLESMAVVAERDEVFREHVKKAQDYAAQIDTDVGFLTFELRPTILDDLGLIAAVENFVYEWSLNHNIHAEFHAAPAVPDRLSSEIEINLYRVVQEALNNVVKYAQAKNVTVQLDFRNAYITLIVEDDGIGFDADNVTPAHNAGNGLGLIGMRERCLLLGGTLEIESSPGSGTVIFARIPT